MDTAAHTTRSSETPMTTIWTDRGTRRVVFTDESYFPALFAFLKNGGSMEVALESVLYDAMKFNRFVAREVQKVQHSGDQKERKKIMGYVADFGFGLKAFMTAYQIKEERLNGILDNLSKYHHIVTRRFQDPNFTVSNSGVLRKWMQDR